MKRKIISLVCIMLSLALALCGCKSGEDMSDLTSGIEASGVKLDKAALSAQSGVINDFAMRLFVYSRPTNQNTLISPISVMNALGMTANGAETRTLEQFEKLLGMSCDTLNPAMQAFGGLLPKDDKLKINLANSIWIRDDENIVVKKPFLQTNADYYNAAIFKEPFGDETPAKINSWVEKNTDGMITDMVDYVSAGVMMYLINALSFEAKWQVPYTENDVTHGVFMPYEQALRNVEMMKSTENLYIEDETSKGFIKPYEGGKYGFLALLPNNDVKISDYIAHLTGERLRSLITSASETPVEACMPKFKSEYSVQMRDMLKDMGFKDAFDAVSADFSKMTDMQVYISEILHKTFIEVGEEGTRAAAATEVEIKYYGAEVPDEDIKRVTLDRPFVYMLIDLENNIPLFVGSMLDTGNMVE